MKVSVIVPIYNKKAYLDKCIKSILDQSYSNIEVILVDDGSTDNSLELCNKYRVDKRVKILSQKNNGVSSARNLGLKNITGEKIIFVDADDYLERDYIEKMLKYNEDLIISGFIIDGVKDVPEIQDNPSTIDILSRKNAKYVVIPYSKIFKSKIIKDNKIRFDEDMNFGEDACFVFDYLKFCKTVRFIEYAGYNNVILEGTLSRKYVEDISNQLDKVYNKIKALTGNKMIRAYWKLRNTKLVIYNNRQKGVKYA